VAVRSLVAISGPDNVGKTTQIRILLRRLHPAGREAGALHEHDGRWVAIIGAGMAAWWFTGSSREELADVLATSYLRRHAALAGSGLSLVDRGIPMLEATLAATLATRFALSDDDALVETLRLLDRYRSNLDECERRETGVVLLHSLDPGDSAARSLQREPDAGETYSRYQRCLARQILRQVEAGRYAHTIVVGDRSIMAVQDELRELLRASHADGPAGLLSQATVVALGGLSESGKSSAADWLRRRHGYTRLKIGFLLEQAATRHRLDDVYALDETVQAELLVDALDRYLTAHYYGDRITIESLHRFGATAALRILLGPALTIVYLDTPRQLRHERGAESLAVIAERDEMKRRRGGHRIVELADLLLPNDGSLLALYHQLDQLAHRRAWPLAAPRVVPAADLGLPEALTIAVEHLVAELSSGEDGADLIAVTGSGARGKYQHGWSDLDVLIIAAPAALDRIRAACHRLRAAISEVKLGLTVISLPECDTSALTPRLVHTMRQIGTGAVPVQWCIPQLRLRYSTAVDDAIVSLADATAAAVELRRQLLRPACEPRAVVKLAALLAKVTLRLTGDDPVDDHAALAAFLRQDGKTDNTGLLTAARTDQELARQLAVHVLDSWLSTLPSTGSSR
jgi:cytidylate kinase